MPSFPAFDAVMVLWGAVVLAIGTVRYFYFDGQRIHIDLPPRLARRVGQRED